MTTKPVDNEESDSELSENESSEVEDASEEVENDSEDGTEEVENNSEEGEDGSEEVENGSEEVEDDAENVEEGSDNENESDEEKNVESNSSDNDEEENDGDDENEETGGNRGWADAVSKILRTKPKKDEPIVLSKAKKLTGIEIKAKPKLAGFEVEQSDGNVKAEIIEEKTVSEPKTTIKRKRRKDLPNFRLKPNVLEKDREKILSKIATRGVVQLFNSVKEQQKDIKRKLDEAGPLENKKNKVMKNINKNTFLDVLMSEKSQNVEEIIGKPNKNDDKLNCKEKVWDVLRDNYMMDAKMKDWDKELEIEDEHELEME